MLVGLKCRKQYGPMLKKFATHRVSGHPTNTHIALFTVGSIVLRYLLRRGCFFSIVFARERSQYILIPHRLPNLGF